MAGEARAPRASRIGLVLGGAAALAVGVGAVMSALSAQSLARADSKIAAAMAIVSDQSASRADLARADVLARQALTRNPLSGKPFVVAASIAQRRGDRATAIGHMEQAGARDPRNIGVRMWLIEQYLRSSRFSDTVYQLDSVMRMRPGMRRQLVMVMAPLLSEAEARPSIADVLSSNPVWRNDFIDLARRDERIASPFYGLIYALGGRDGFSMTDGQLSDVVNVAIGRGDHQVAQTLYNRFVQRTDAEPTNRIIDGNFRGVPGPAPFNWTLGSAAAGFAQIDDVGNRGQLQVRTFGGGAAVLASQTVIVAPGEYLFATSGTLDAAREGDDLGWNLTCGRTNLQLGRLSAAARGSGRFQSEVRLAIPVECPTLSLQLAYSPAGRGSFSAMTFDRVALTPVEALAR